MGEPTRQYEPVDLFEFKRQLLAGTETAPMSSENPLSELARIVGGGGHILPADPDPRDEVSTDGRTSAKAQTASPPKTDVGPLPSPRMPAVDPRANDNADLSESASADRRSDANRAPCRDEDPFMAPAKQEHLPQRKRQSASTSFYVTTSAVVIAVILAAFLVWPGSSTLERRRLLPEVRQPVANSAFAIAPSPPAVAADYADATGGAQLSSMPQQVASLAIVAPRDKVTIELPIATSPPLKLVDSEQVASEPGVSAPALPPPDIPADEQQQMMLRVAILLGQGDVAGARAILERLDRAGNGQASFGLAQTYDPAMLSRWNVLGIKPDADKAMQLYRRALDEGIPEAQEHLIASGSQQP